MTTRTAYLPAQRQPPLARLARQTGADTAYLLTGFPLALISFVLVITILSTGLGLMVTLVGIPIITGTLYVARGFAEAERWRIAKVLGEPRVPGAYRRSISGEGFRRYVLAPIADGQAWLDVLHTIVLFPISVATWSITVTWVSGAIGGITYVGYDWALPRSPDNRDLPDLLGMSDTAATRIILYTAAGIFFLGTLPVVTRLSTLLQASIGKALLTGMTELRTRITGLEQDRDTAKEQTAAAVSAETTALRRLERDIHDGPQQRLVRLAMDLGRAAHQIDTDPQAARATVAEALAQTRETLDELRALSRGIAPPVLVDRGLTAAVAALAGRSLVPVDLDAPDLGRLDPTVESTAYFVLAEALTNVAKHSHANECQLVIRRDGSHLEVSVTDDGVGGAALAKGHGLAGLADRVHATGGGLTVLSPAGGPTTITARLPINR